MKLTRRSRLTIIIFLLTLISTIVFMQADSVRAAVNGIHAFMVIVRVETEIMQKIPAGQYYEALFWKHNDEVMRITSEHPENVEKLKEALLLFIPGLEALVDGKGDTVVITDEQVDGLRVQLDWYAYWGSPDLREDIEKEKQRLQLDHFVGLTMTEALDYVNTTWIPTSEVVKNLVPDSNGMWAYFIHQGVYLEYPSQYFVQVAESENDYVYFFPSTGMPEQWHPFVMKVKVWSVPPNENTDAHSWYSQENVVWEIPVQTEDFQGFEFIKGRAILPKTDIHTFLYNQQKQLAVEIKVFAYESSWGMDIDYDQLVNQRYEYFQHMVDHIRIATP